MEMAAQTWASSTRIGSAVEAQGNAIIVDASGNVFATGSFHDAAIFGNGITLTSNGYSDMFLAKYTPGGVPLWAIRAGMSGDDQGNDVQVDAAGYVYVTGFFTDSIQFATASGSLIAYSAGETDLFIAKFDPLTGYALWLASAGGPSVDGGTGLALMGSEVYALGYFDLSCDFGATSLSGIGGRDICLGQYSQGTNSWVWAAKGGSVGTDQAAGICSDGTALYITGNFSGPLFSFGATNVAGLGGMEGFLIKLDANGTAIWSSYVSAAAGDIQPTAICSDGASIYVTGNVSGPVPMTFYSGSTLVVTSPGQFSDFWIARFAPGSGHCFWATAEGGNGADHAQTVVNSGSTTVTIAGVYESAITLAGTPLAGTGREIFVESFSTASGQPMAAEAAGGPGASVAQDVAFNSTCGLWITGGFDQSLTCGSLPALTSAGGTNGFIANLNYSSPNPPSQSPSTAGICLGDTITITLSGAFSTVTWEFSTDNGATWLPWSGANSDSIQVSPTVTTYYRSTYSGPCLGGMDTTRILVGGNVQPTISGLPDTTCLTAASILLTLSPSVPMGTPSYTSPGFTDLGGGNMSFSPAAAGTGIHAIGYTYVDTSGCTVSTSDSILVAPPLAVDITGIDPAYCGADTIARLLVGSHAPLGTFSTSCTCLTDLGNGTAMFHPHMATLGTTLWIRYTYHNGCSNQVVKAVTVHPQPIPAFTPLQAAYCSTDSIATIMGNYGGWGTFTSGAWLTDLGGSIATVNPSLAPPDSTIQVVYHVTDSNQCSASDTQATYLSSLPIADAGNDHGICPGIAVTVGSPPIPGYTYQWSELGVGPVDTLPQATVLPLATTQYALEVQNAHGCADQDTVQVTVGQSVMADAGADSSLCLGDSVALGGLFGPGLVKWSDSLGFASNSPHPMVSPSQSQSYLLVVTDTLGYCADTDRVHITVIPPAAPANAGPDQMLGAATSTTLAASDAFPGTGTWTCVGSAFHISDSHSPTATISDLMPGTWTLVWNVESAPCPSSSDSMRIMVTELRLPTGFSPNDDGVNDFLVFSGLESFPHNTLKVFNRWGNLILDVTHYHNDWGGTNPDGQPLVEDTYYYILDLGDGRAINHYLVLKR